MTKDQWRYLTCIVGGIVLVMVVASQLEPVMFGQRQIGVVPDIIRATLGVCLGWLAHYLLFGKLRS